ncbi:MAG: relaxase MobL [Peptococcaceae bacterium]|jgi:TPR repeat protein|nr:relaxase MobL [Peptococcaceae bacterium]
MPRVIFICPHLKAGQTAARRENYVRYIATREGVEILPGANKHLPATWRQKRLIGELLRDFPDTAERFEYEDCLANPTRENASAFITAALEQNLAFLGKRENYVDYIARRPRAQRMGAHGLFTDSGEPIALDPVAKEAAAHPGALWLPIISLRREDAARLGYDNAANWRAFLSSYARDMAAGLKIRPEHFRWYAAYHDEGHHPHVHMICWSEDPREGFLTRQGIYDIKSGLATRLFRQELLHVYEQQTAYRQQLGAQAKDEMAALVDRMEHGALRSETIEDLMARLAEKLRGHKGKKQYGYLPAPVKDIVDRIVDELAKDGRVAETYAKWCETRMEVLRTYRKDPPRPGPLSQQKELKRVRNAVVEEAAKLAAGTFVFEVDANEDGLFPEAKSPGMDQAELTGSDTDTPMEPDEDDGSVLPDAESLIADQSELTGLDADASIEPNTNDDSLLPGAGSPVMDNTASAEPGENLAVPDANSTATEPRDAAVKSNHTAAVPDPGDSPMESNDATATPGIGDAAMESVGDVAAPSIGNRRAKKHPHIQWSSRYKQAKKCLYGSAASQRDLASQRDPAVKRDPARAFALMKAEAETGNALALHDLGRMYADGLGCEADPEAAQARYAEALAAFQTDEGAEPWEYSEYRIGKMFAMGLGTERDAAKAAEWFSLSAAKRYKYAQYSLGGLYLRGEGVTQDYETAFKLYAASAAQDFPYADYELAKLYRDGVGTERNAESADAHFRRAFTGFVALEAQSHDDKLQYRLGRMLEDGVGTATDVPATIRYYEQAAEVHNVYAQYRLARLILADSAATAERAAQAVAWLSEAAVCGGVAAYALGKLCRDGSYVAKDAARAVSLFTQAAESESGGYAAYALGKLYLQGEDIPKDATEAVRWLTQSADQGNSYAQYALAMVYLKDEEIPKDVARALPLLRQSADAGNEHALYRLGRLYLVGEDVPKDVNAALQYLTDSAERGNQYAQYALGKLYLMGGDIPRDRDAARRWLELAAAQGNEYAAFFLEHFDSFRDPSLFLTATRLLRHMGQIFRDNPPVPARASDGDRKLRRREQEKKIAQGHARGDYATLRNIH